MIYAQLIARLTLYLAAETAVLQGQEYQVGQGGGGRRLRRADLADIRAEIGNINAQIAAAPDNPANISARARRIRYLRPMC